MKTKRLTYDYEGRHFCDYPTRTIINRLAECEIMLEKIEQIADDKNINGDLLRMSEIRWVLSGARMESENKEMEIGKIYRPSEVSFEDKDTRIIVDAIRCGRVEYTNLITKEYGEISIDDFGWYYDKVESEMQNDVEISKKIKKWIHV